MIIKMVTHMSGGRYDDRQWPAPGVPFEVPDEEGQGLVRWGHAVKVADSPPKPAHVPPAAQISEPAETAAGPVHHHEAEREHPPAEPVLDLGPKAEVPSASSPKAAWIEYAVGQGMEADAAMSMTKADLMSRYGDRA